jgi:hypothetical protein
MGPGARAPLVLEMPRLLEGGRSLAEQDGLASKAKDTIGPAGGGEHVDDCGGGNMTIAADEAVGMGPVAPQRRQQPHQEHGIFGASRARARTQGGHDEGRRGPCENEERQIAMVLRVRILERNLLLALGGVSGVIEVEHHRGGGLCVTGHKVRYKGLGKPREILALDVVLQARDRRRTRQIVGRIQGRPLHPKFAQGVTAETLGVIGVCIPRSDWLDTRR